MDSEGGTEGKLKGTLLQPDEGARQADERRMQRCSSRNEVIAGLISSWLLNSNMLQQE